MPGEAKPNPGLHDACRRWGQHLHWAMNDDSICMRWSIPTECCRSGFGVKAAAAGASVAGT